MQNFRRKDAAAYKRKLFKDVSSLCIHPLATRIFLECFRSKRTLLCTFVSFSLVHFKTPVRTWQHLSELHWQHLMKTKKWYALSHYYSLRKGVFIEQPSLKMACRHLMVKSSFWDAECRKPRKSLSIAAEIQVTVCEKKDVAERSETLQTAPLQWFWWKLDSIRSCISAALRTSRILTWTTWSWVKTCFSSKPSRLLSPLCATTLGPQGKVNWKQVTIWLTGASEYVHQDSPCLQNCHRVYEIWKPSINGPWTWQYLRRHLVAAVDTRHKPQPTFTLNCTGIHVLSHIMLLTYETTTGDPDPIHSVSCGFQFQRHVKLFGTSGGKNSQCNEFSLEGYTFIWRFNCGLSQCHSSKPYE